MNRIKQCIFILESVAFLFACCACSNVDNEIESSVKGHGAAGLDLSYKSETDRDRAAAGPCLYSKRSLLYRGCERSYGQIFEIL